MDTPDGNMSPLGDDHFVAFGVIIHMFARFESLMISIMSQVAQADFIPIAMMAAELPYRGKRETVLAMIKAKPLPADQVERISWFMGELHKRSALRNSIAHSVWTQGSRPESVKPLSLSIRGGVASTRGVDPEEADFTVTELIGIGNELIALFGKFQRYLLDHGIVPNRSAEEGSR